MSIISELQNSEGIAQKMAEEKINNPNFLNRLKYWWLELENYGLGIYIRLRRLGERR
ncbi:hypothetical protein ACIQD3_22645 [Peribacillus loiseleuriae]|uniref:hypothetical protein n=1 Tax=Peribacillus loiseleuriae TaxID=1679170 RepID=UPI0038148676